LANRYRNISTTVNADGRRYRRNPIYPEIPKSGEDIYLIASEGDRYDTLASTYYGDPTLWWIIATANSSSNRASLIPNLGTQIRIPYNKQEAIARFNSLNQNR